VLWAVLGGLRLGRQDNSGAGMALQLLALITLSLLHTAAPIRCYTDLAATQSKSLECGMATGCVKITKKADDFDPVTGKFIPVERRRKNVDLFRGCFLISTPTVCYTAKDGPNKGLTYCWCSNNDLCNRAAPPRAGTAFFILVFLTSLTSSLS